MEDMQLDEMLADSFLDEQHLTPAVRASKPLSAYNKLQLEEWLALGYLPGWKEQPAEQY